MRNRSPKGASKSEGHSVEHYTRLADEFGFSRGSYHAPDEGRAMSRTRFLLQPLSLFIMSLLVLVALCGVQMWRFGVFDPIFGPKSAKVEKGPKRWMLNGRSARVADDRMVDVDEPDIDRGPPTEDEGDVKPVLEPAR